MAIQKTEAILLRKQDLRETSLILTFYTRSFGKVKGVVKGARGPRSQCGGGAFEPLVHDEIIFYERKNAELFTISQCDLIEFFNPIRKSLEKLSYATYLTELLESVTTLTDKNEGLFELLLNSLHLLASGSSPKRVARIFEIKLISTMGIMPELSSCTICAGPAGENAKFSFRNGGLVCKNCLRADMHAVPILQGTVNFIGHIQNSNIDKVERVKVSERVGKELEAILKKFLEYHVGRRLKTLEFIKAIER